MSQQFSVLLKIALLNGVHRSGERCAWSIERTPVLNLSLFDINLMIEKYGGKMKASNQEFSKNLVHLRGQNPSWQLLASRRGPLVISSLKYLFETNYEGVLFEDAERHLIGILSQYVNRDEFEINNDHYGVIARKELRDWIKKGLIVERAGKIIATDALQQVFQFIEGLEERIMTSTASRLSTVQREIENLEVLLSPDPKTRIKHIKDKIKKLKEELEEIKKVGISTLPEEKAIEAIRDVYNLTISLRSDFRRVEDSYREADKKLRRSIISEQHNRGEIVDSLLDGHSELLASPEGQVFYGFYEQLIKSIELDNMKRRLEIIIKSPFANEALASKQLLDLRRLVTQLVKESSNVIRARSQGEKDVRGFLKTGIAVEHHRVGQVLNEIFNTALKVDWESASTRRSPVSLPPIGITSGHLPLIERLSFYHDTGDSGQIHFDLQGKAVNLGDIEDDFWESFDSFDEEKTIKETLGLLAKTKRPMSISDLVKYLSPTTHDLETISLWVWMAREASIPISSEREEFEIIDEENRKTLFRVPKIMLTIEAFDLIALEY